MKNFNQFIIIILEYAKSSPYNAIFKVGLLLAIILLFFSGIIFLVKFF